MAKKKTCNIFFIRYSTTSFCMRINNATYEELLLFLVFDPASDL